MIKKKKNIQQQTEKKIFSIGYEAISIDGYLNKLIKNNIHLLCDVRCNEKKHTDCHRSRLSDYLAKNYKIKTEHL